MSRVSHERGSHVPDECLKTMSRVNESCLEWMSHVLYMNESCVIIRLFSTDTWLIPIGMNSIARKYAHVDLDWVHTSLFSFSHVSFLYFIRLFLVLVFSILPFFVQVKYVCTYFPNIHMYMYTYVYIYIYVCIENTPDSS